MSRRPSQRQTSPAEQPMAVQAAAFIMRGESGMNELAWREPHRDTLKRRYRKRQDLLDAVAVETHGYQYMRLVGPRWRPGEPLDRTREGVEWRSRNVWIDVDEACDEQEFRERLDWYGFDWPSMIWTTGGRGFWALWKLKRPAHVEWIERMNQMLADLLGGDPACHDATRLCRIPLSFHNTTGVQGEIVSFTQEQHEPEIFDYAYRRYSGLLEAERAQQQAAVSHKRRKREVVPYAETPCDPAPGLAALTEANWTYIDDGVATRVSRSGDNSRSAEEESVLYRILTAGHTQAEAAWIAHEVLRLPRLVEDLERGREDRVADSIARAERLVQEHHGSQPRNSSPDTLRPHRQRRRALGVYLRRSPDDRLVPALMHELGIQKSQAYEYAKRLRALTAGATLGEIRRSIGHVLARKGPFFFWEQVTAALEEVRRWSPRRTPNQMYTSDRKGVLRDLVSELLHLDLAHRIAPKAVAHAPP